MRRRIIPYNPALKQKAKLLRSSMTYSEVMLWNRIKNFQMMGYDFDRQRPILNFIIDFYCKDLQLVIEVDGITHHDENVMLKDEVRDDELGMYEVSILRFNALEVVRNMNAVLQIIENWILSYEEKNGVEDHVLKRRVNPPLPLRGGDTGRS